LKRILVITKGRENMNAQEALQKQIPQGEELAKENVFPYEPPQMIVYGSITTLTKGGGGRYGDECTSGKHDEDERY